MCAAACAPVFAMHCCSSACPLCMLHGNHHVDSATSECYRQVPPKLPPGAPRTSMQASPQQQQRPAPSPLSYVLSMRPFLPPSHAHLRHSQPLCHNLREQPSARRKEVFHPRSHSAEPGSGWDGDELHELVVT
jgi:hypothetical protein